MSDTKKPIRLVDVGELEADLKKDLAEEEAKGKDDDILFCESISDALDDLSNLPTIDPETLRPVAHWEESVCFDDAFWVCSNCKFPSEAIAAPRLYHYCPNCGAKMEDATNG
nr:MAG TPA: hydrogenase/urease nickel incorporation protein [Caudoviricetes sp.]